VAKGLFPRPFFTGFGPNGLLVSPECPPFFAIRGRRPARLRALVRADCPRRPGVYGMVDGHGELIYVGKAKCLRSRLLSYFRPNSRDPKAGRILEQTRLLSWEEGDSEFAALLRELELIRRWRPRFNVQGQPRRLRHGYVCLGRRPAPYVFLATRPPSTAFARFGPVPVGHTAREAVRRVNDWYRLRDCPQAQEMVFADQQELFPVERAPGCIRHEIGQCLAPCAAACTRADYAGNVRAARGFLEGRDLSPLEVLERDMTAASAALSFERAAALRDKLALLRWLHERLARVREAARLSCVYAVGGFWYLIHGGRVRVALPAPPEGGRNLAVEATLRAVYQRGKVAERESASASSPSALTLSLSRAPTSPPPGLDEVDGVLLVAAWFRKYPEERERARDPFSILAASPD
jgi:excinuclease ABC subunit C